MGSRQQKFYAVFLCSCSWKTSILQTNLNMFRGFHILEVILQNAKSLTKMLSAVSSHWPQFEDTSSMEDKVFCR